MLIIFSGIKLKISKFFELKTQSSSKWALFLFIRISKIINMIYIEGYIGFLIKGLICFIIVNIFYAIYFIKSDSACIIKNRIKDFKLEKCKTHDLKSRKNIKQSE